MLRFNLRQLLLALTCGSVLLTLAISLSSGRVMQRDLLIHTSLEANRLYAMKIAKSTDVFLRMTQERLRYASEEIAASWLDEAEVEGLARRLLEDSATFNSVLVVDAEGDVAHVEPARLGLRGVRLDTPGSREALAVKAPTITEPFVGVTGNFIISMSHPIQSEDGTYLGYLSGSVYLHDATALHSLLGEHDFQDGSYLYVVDEAGRIIYHQDRSRIGDVVTANPVVRAVMAGQTGSMRVRNTLGVDVLAGYASVEVSQWGVVAQQPVAVTLANLRMLMLRNLQDTLPGVLLALILIWFLARSISRPLAELAQRAQAMDEPDTKDALERVRSWYFEAAQIKASLLKGLAEVGGKMQRLHQESHTDQLTGLANRREMTHTLAAWQEAGIPFAVLVLDVDHFKRVNDVYGHDSGDTVLRELAALMRTNARPGDLLCRTGGEEFAMFLPRATLAAGTETAERLRLAVDTGVFSGVGRLTVSCGVSHVPEGAPDFTAAMKAADAALYQAKAGGRNRVVTAFAAVPPRAS